MRIAPAVSMAAVLLACCLCGQEQTPPADEVPKTDPLPPPDCNSYTIASVPSLNFKQRACFWGSQLFTGSAVSGAALWSAVGVLRHKPEEWPQDLNGFGRQFGTRYTQSMVKSTATFIAGTITREDPRPDPPSVHGCPHPTTVKGRIGQSLKRTVWSYRETEMNSCGGRPAPGRLIGSFASGFVQLAWLPPSQNNLTTALLGTGTAFGGYIGDSLISEFQGDIFRIVGH